MRDAVTRRAEQPERPSDGDVVIAADGRQPQRYTISQAPGGPQASWTSREQAFAFARDFAQQHAVDVWMVDGSLTTRVARHRPLVAPGPRQQSSPAPR
jgi:hypothetical protein